MDYEAALEKQFERKLQQLVAWRRAKGEVDTSSSVIKNG
jgi:DNA gyrase inhibitor GyrI